ncbi:MULTISPECIES: hypothetical protein [Vibrio harveyi group]|nr:MULTISPECIES: hypothetical protein [Vibrio harveyi group]
MSNNKPKLATNGYQPVKNSGKTPVNQQAKNNNSSGQGTPPKKP